MTTTFTIVDGVDRATVNIDRGGALRLVLHQGAARHDEIAAVIRAWLAFAR